MAAHEHIHHAKDDDSGDCGHPDCAEQASGILSDILSMRRPRLVLAADEGGTVRCLSSLPPADTVRVLRGVLERFEREGGRYHTAHLN